MDIYDKEYKGRACPTFTLPRVLPLSCLDMDDPVFDALVQYNGEYTGYGDVLGHDKEATIIRMQCASVDQEWDDAVHSRCSVSHYHEVVFLNLRTMQVQSIDAMGIWWEMTDDERMSYSRMRY